MLASCHFVKPVTFFLVVRRQRRIPAAAHTARRDNVLQHVELGLQISGVAADGHMLGQCAAMGSFHWSISLTESQAKSKLCPYTSNPKHLRQV